MSDSLSRWLRLREPADTAARSDELARGVAAALAPGEAVRLLDLGTGTGSNIRFLAERVPGPQQWLAVDRSADLLAELPERLSSWGATRGYQTHTANARCLVRGASFECEIELCQRELGRLCDPELFAGRHVVTASALLDLVSESWLQALAAQCRNQGALALFAITYNGRFECAPAETEDDMVRALMNQHQQTDKGFGGRSAGPHATAIAERCFVEAGYRVRREPSDWMLGPADGDVQRVLIDGWAEAATEMAPDRAPLIARWRARRLAHVSEGRSRIVVGHDDLAAWPDHPPR